MISGHEFNPRNDASTMTDKSKGCSAEEWFCNIKQVPQPEESPIQVFYAYFCDCPQGQEDERIKMIALPSFLNIEEARKRAAAYAQANNFSMFILMVAREIVKREL